MRGRILILVIILTLVLASTPASAQFFVCEKTDYNNDPIAPDDPLYENADYDNDLVHLIQPLISTGMMVLVVFGLFGAVYATIRDAFYTPTEDSDPARYVRMRVKAILAGLGIPTAIMVGGWIVEWYTKYESTCMLPSLL